MHENQGEGHFCRRLNEKGKEGVAFASNETIQELCTHITASGNNPNVVILRVFFMDVLLAPYPKHVTLESVSGAKSFKISTLCCFLVCCLIYSLCLNAIYVQTIRKTCSKITLCHNFTLRHEFKLKRLIFRLLSLKK